MAADNHLLIVTNLVNGINIYSLPPGQPLRSFTHRIHLNVPLLVSSALQGSLIVVGGDNGSARVYDSCIGLLTVLPHGPGISIHFRPILQLIPVTSWNTGADCCGDFLPPVASFSRMLICRIDTFLFRWVPYHHRVLGIKWCRHQGLGTC